MIDWPVTLIPHEMTLGVASNAKTFQSPFTGAVQTVSYPGAKVKVTLKYSNLTQAQADELETLLMELDGQAGRVRLWDFRARLVSSPQPVNGHPVVAEATAMRTVCTTRGWTPGAKVLTRGQWVQIGTELKRVLSDVTADASGAATLRIAPMLRSTWPSGTALTVDRPCGIFQLDKDEWSGDATPGTFYSYSIPFVEVFYP